MCWSQYKIIKDSRYRVLKQNPSNFATNHVGFKTYEGARYGVQTPAVLRHVTLCRLLVNDQLDAQFFTMYLFQFSTCFEQPRAHHQENQLYQYNLWYMSLCVGDRFVCRSTVVQLQTFRSTSVSLSSGSKSPKQQSRWYRPIGEIKKMPMNVIKTYRIMN